MDLHYDSMAVMGAATAMIDIQQVLDPAAGSACAPWTVGTIFGPRSAALEAKAALIERTEEAARFAGLAALNATELAAKFFEVARYFNQLEAH